MKQIIFMWFHNFFRKNRTKKVAIFVRRGIGEREKKYHANRQGEGRAAYWAGPHGHVLTCCRCCVPNRRNERCTGAPEPRGRDMKVKSHGLGWAGQVSCRTQVNAQCSLFVHRLHITSLVLLVSIMQEKSESKPSV